MFRRNWYNYITLKNQQGENAEIDPSKKTTPNTVLMQAAALTAAPSVPAETVPAAETETVTAAPGETGTDNATATEATAASDKPDAATGDATEAKPEQEIIPIIATPIIEKYQNPVARIYTSLGMFEAEIYLDKMPITASSFIDLVKDKFYDGLHFHRVVKNFMIQTGCPYSKDPKNRRAGTGGPPDQSGFTILSGEKKGTKYVRSREGCIKDEFVHRISNKCFTLSMANAGPNSGGSQFFVNTVDNIELDFWDRKSRSAHAVFGKVTHGQSVVLKIGITPAKEESPITPIRLDKIVIRGQGI